MVNPAASLEKRANAMTRLISFALVYPRWIAHVDRDILKRLLQEEATDNDDRVELARLARAAAFSGELWQDTKEEIEQAIRKVMKDFDIPAAPVADRQSLIRDADKCLRVYNVLVSRPPASEDDED